MKKLRVGVVGVGHIGKNHARLYAETDARFQPPSTTRTRRRPRSGGAIQGARGRSLEEFAGVGRRCVDRDADEFPFCGRAAAPGNGKHLLIEKPIAEDTAHASELAELAAQRRSFCKLGTSNVSIPS